MCFWCLTLSKGACARHVVPERKETFSALIRDYNLHLRFDLKAGQFVFGVNLLKDGGHRIKIGLKPTAPPRDA